MQVRYCGSWRLEVQRSSERWCSHWHAKLLRKLEQSHWKPCSTPLAVWSSSKLEIGNERVHSREVQRSLLLHENVSLNEIWNEVKSGDSLDFLTISLIITLDCKEFVIWMVLTATHRWKYLRGSPPKSSLFHKLPQKFHKIQ